MQSLVKSLQYRFSLVSRKQKFDLFWHLMAPHPGERVLNIGGAPPHLGGALTGDQKDDCIEQPEQDSRWECLDVVSLNLDHENSRQYGQAYRGTNRMAVTGDACRLPFAEKSFDIVFSNAVIEHVPAKL